MAIKFNRSQTFATNGTVTAAGLHNLVDGLDVYQALITDQTALTSVSTADKLLIADNDLTASDAPRSVAVQELFDDALTGGTFTNAQLSGNLTYGTATGNRTVSTSATITTGTINNATLGTTSGTSALFTSGTLTSGVIPAGTFGTTTSTAATITNGTIQTLTIGTTTATAANITNGTVSTLNSTTGTISSGLISNLTTGSGTSLLPSFSPTGDSDTGVFFPSSNTIGISTQGTEALRIDQSGQIGIGTTSPTAILDINASDLAASPIVRSDSSVGFTVARYDNTPSSPTLALRKGRGTFASQLPVQTADISGRFAFQAYGGSNNRTIARIAGIVNTYTSDTDIAGTLRFETSPNGSTTPAARVDINPSGNVGINTTSPVNKLDLVGSFGRGAPVTKTADFTLADTENWIINNKSGSSCTVTFPAASSWTGRELTIKNLQAQTVVSASSNVVPRNSTVAGTAILAATAGAWATIVSDGTNWVIMCGS